MRYVWARAQPELQITLDHKKGQALYLSRFVCDKAKITHPKTIGRESRRELLFDKIYRIIFSKFKDTQVYKTGETVLITTKV
jgi:hypothetical protein